MNQDGEQEAETPPDIGHGRYQLLAVLGKGGMATVWRARDTETGLERAIKILHTDVAQRKSYRSRFLAEARTLGRLDHPNILKVFDVGEEEGRFWFVAEVVEGGALIDYLEQRGKMPPLESLDTTFQVLQALGAAHLEGVVHRDVKPDNILLSPDGRVRLSDFGIARIRNERVDHRTRTGVAMGTVGYMAPEQRENARGVGPGADLYSVGATLYALVTGLEPQDLFASQLDPRLLDGVPPAIRDVVRKSTAYRPEYRYLGARAMAVDVAAAYDAIARGDGLPERSEEWLARFDALLVRKPSPVGPLGAGRTAVSARDEVLPPEPDEFLPDFTSEEILPTPPTVARAASPAPTATRPTPRPTAPISLHPVAAQPSRGWWIGSFALGALAVMAAVAGAVHADRAERAGIVDVGACVGTWSGSYAGLSDTRVPLRLELIDAGHGRVSGRAVEGDVASPVEGACTPGAMVLDETSASGRRGQFSGRIAREGLTGAYDAGSGSGVVSFTLSRAIRPTP